MLKEAVDRLIKFFNTVIYNPEKLKDNILVRPKHLPGIKFYSNENYWNFGREARRRKY